MLAYFVTLRSFQAMLILRQIFIMAAAISLLGFNLQAKPVAIDGFAASVNGEMIMVGDVLQYIAPAQQQLRTLPKTKETQKKLERLFEEGLNALIEKELILAEF